MLEFHFEGDPAKAASNRAKHRTTFEQASHARRKARLREQPMSESIDFSRGERGKFFREDAKRSLPVYLDEDIHRYLSERAASKGVELSQMVNEILQQDINLIEAVK